MWDPPRSATLAPSLPENADPRGLPTSASLADDLLARADEFEATLNSADPAASGFVDDEALDAFYAAGRVLAARLAIELGADHEILYGDARFGGGYLSSTKLERWWDLSGEPAQRAGLAKELNREVARSHVLYDKPVEVIARCDLCDDILINLPDDGAHAVVHLTWRQESDPRWPMTEVHTDVGSLLADLSERH